MHSENLKVIFCNCGRKTPCLRNVSPGVSELVRLYAQPTYDGEGGFHPTAICDACRKACTAWKGDGPQHVRHRFPTQHLYVQNVHLDELSSLTTRCNIHKIPCTEYIVKIA